MTRRLSLAVLCAIVGLLFLSGIEVGEAQTVPPGMMLIDCPVRPAPWQVPGIAGHPGFDLQRDPGSAYSIIRGVPAQCIDYPGGSEAIYHQIIGLKVYVPRHGTDPGSQTGALATAVVICDLSGCGAHQAGSSPDQEWFRSGQDWRNYVSDNGRWLYSVRGGLNTQTCDVTNQPDYRRWLVLVQERELTSCLDKLWERGGVLGRPVMPVPTSQPTAVPTTVPTPQPVATSVVAPPTATPAPTPSADALRLTQLEADMKELREQQQRIIDLLTTP